MITSMATCIPLQN